MKKNLKLIQVRLKAGYMTQKDFALVIGVNTEAVNRWENYQYRTTPRMENVFAISEILDLSPRQVVDLFEHENKKK